MTLVEPSLDNCASLITVKNVTEYERRQLRDTPPPFPYGWFAVSYSKDLKPQKLITRQFMGRDIVIYRTKSGVARAIEAYCPHLGAHFGHGGSVVGEELRCPFHGLRFATDGTCAYSPFGRPPKAARLGRLELREILGMVMVWHGPTSEPTWEIDVPDDGTNWLPLHTSTSTMRSHPQEVSENSVDVAHLSVLHGFRDVEILDPLTVDGPRLRTRYTITKPIPGIRNINGIRAVIHVRVDGLGFSLVELEVMGWGMRQFVVTTPKTERELTVYLASSVRERGDSRASRAGWNVVEKLVGRGILAAVISEVSSDKLVWEHKKYLKRPAIAAGDGPIPKYRSWARQFYPEGAEV